jgi:thymidylate kinase
VERVVRLFKLVVNRVPDLTILLHPNNPEAVLERLKARTDKDRFEREDREFFNRVIDVYADLAHGQDTLARVMDVLVIRPETWLVKRKFWPMDRLPVRAVINAELSPEEVVEQAYELIMQALVAKEQYNSWLKTVGEGQ